MLKSEFNSDIIATESWIENYGFDVKESLILVEVSDSDPQVAIDNIAKEIAKHGDSIALVSLSLVSSHFSHYYDVKQLRGACNKHNIKIFIDLAHALGSVPLHLNELDVDAAVFSTAKFLNSGPGSIGGLYINPRHKGVKSGLRGWFGTERAVLTL
jgi:kynureninase